MTLDADGTVKSASYYHAFGKHDDKLGGIETDKHRANTKVEDDDGLLNEGKRFRSLEYAIFLTPDPLEYQDGLNFYLYCGQNPWGRFDPLGLSDDDAGTAMRKSREAYLDALARVDPAAAKSERQEFFDRSEDGSKYLGRIASTATDKVPVVSSFKSFVEFVTGEDPVSKDEISRAEAAVGIVLGIFGAKGAKGKKAHGNSKHSTNAQHNYDIINVEDGTVMKTGVSGGKTRKDGTSVRGESQARKWNKQENTDKYKSNITNEIPEGAGAREKALDYEKNRADNLRKSNPKNLPKEKHVKP